MKRFVQAMRKAKNYPIPLPLSVKELEISDQHRITLRKENFLLFVTVIIANTEI